MSVIAMLCCILAQTIAVVEVQVTSDPPLPCANLIQNPFFEGGEGNAPAQWRWTTAVPDNFITEWSDGGRTGKCLHIKSHSGVMSGYWGQSVHVQPETEYALTGRFRIAGGKLLTYVHARAPDGQTLDERFYADSMRNHFLVPVFLKAKYMRGLDAVSWHPLRVEFKALPGMEWVAVSAGLYFEAGEVWYDDLSVIPLRTDLTMLARGAEGELVRVRLLSSAAEGPLMDEAVDPLADEFDRTIPGVSTEAQYTLEATDARGQVARCVYPREVAP